MTLSSRAADGSAIQTRLNYLAAQPCLQLHGPFPSTARILSSAFLGIPVQDFDTGADDIFREQDRTATMEIHRLMVWKKY